MRKLIFTVLALSLALPFEFSSLIAKAGVSAGHFQENGSPRVLSMPRGGRRRRVRAERRSRRGIRSAFKRAGLSAGRGGRRFGRNVARGRIVRGGRELGRGMGGFGKHTGRGLGRTMRRVFKP